MSTIESWKCLPGDEVRFVLKRGASLSSGLIGVVKSRTEKYATVSTEIKGKDKIFTVHLASLEIINPIPRVLCLKAKFRLKPKNHRRVKKLPVSKEVGGMLFNFKKNV